MAITRYKTFSDGQVLTAADLNGIQDQVINNEQSVGNPRTTSFDMDGQRLILSADGNTSLISSTSSKIDFRLASADLFDLDGTVSSPVNGLTFIASATGVNTFIQAKGSDTNVGVTVASKGAAGVVLRTNGGPSLIVTHPGATPTQQITITAATTGNAPSIAASGTDTDVNLLLAPKGAGSIDINGVPVILDADGDSTIREISDDVIAIRLQAFDAFIFDGDQITQTRGLRFRAQNNTNDPSIAAESADTDVNIRLIPKGAGVVANAGGWAVDGATNLTWRWQGSGTSLLLQENTGTAAVPIWTTRTTVTTGGTIAGPTLISTHSLSSGTSLSIDLSGFSRYVVQLSFFTATDSVYLQARTKDSLSAGSYESGASDYAWQYTENSGAGSLNAVGDIADSEIELCTSNIGNDTLEMIDLKVEIDPSSFAKRITWDGGYIDSAGQHRAVQGSGKHLGNAATLLGIQFSWEGGAAFAAVSIARVWGMP